jgi:hypothetical protein
MREAELSEKREGTGSRPQSNASEYREHVDKLYVGVVGGCPDATHVITFHTQN